MEQDNRNDNKVSTPLSHREGPGEGPKYDMAGRPLPDRTYPAETGSAGYKLHERTLGQWLEYWAETTPDKEYIVYSDRDLRFTWSKSSTRAAWCRSYPHSYNPRYHR